MSDARRERPGTSLENGNRVLEWIIWLLVAVYKVNRIKS